MDDAVRPDGGKIKETWCLVGHWRGLLGNLPLQLPNFGSLKRKEEGAILQLAINPLWDSIM